MIKPPVRREDVRRTVDLSGSVLNFLQDHGVKYPVHHRWGKSHRRLPNHYSFARDLPLPLDGPPEHGICSSFVSQAVGNKGRSAIHCTRWTPDGKRVITCTQTGELTLWNGVQFHFENVQQAHNGAIRCMEWTPNEHTLLTGDVLGQIKLWDRHFMNFKTINAHKEAVRDVSVAPTGSKFVSCADDSHCKIWDLKTGKEERTFLGHGWDVKCCAWHSRLGLVATGSKDSLIKLWDPRSGESITTLFAHKNIVNKVAWTKNGKHLISVSKDQMVKVFDVKTMSARAELRGHSGEVASIALHPEYESQFATCGEKGHLIFWDVYQQKPVEDVPHAHDGTIWDLAFHPLGHLLVTAGHEHMVKFWARARPGDPKPTDLLPPPFDPDLGAALPEPLETGLRFGIFAPQVQRKAEPTASAPAPKRAKVDEAQVKVSSMLDDTGFD